MRHQLPADGGANARIQAQGLQVHPEMLLLEISVPGRTHPRRRHRDRDGGKRRPRRPLKTLALLLQAARGVGNASAAAARYLRAESHTTTKGQTRPGNQARDYGAIRKPRLPRLRKSTLRRRRRTSGTGLPKRTLSPAMQCAPPPRLPLRKLQDPQSIA